MDRRFGYFEMATCFIGSYEWSVAAPSFHVLRCEHLYENGALRIVAWSPLFKQLKEGEVTPKYSISFCQVNVLGQIAIEVREIFRHCEAY